jgi:hypothetical protein
MFKTDQKPKYKLENMIENWPETRMQIDLFKSGD